MEATTMTTCDGCEREMGKTQQRYVKFRKVAWKPLWHNGFPTLCPPERLHAEPLVEDAFGRDTRLSGTQSKSNTFASHRI